MIYIISVTFVKFAHQHKLYSWTLYGRLPDISRFTHEKEIVKACVMGIYGWKKHDRFLGNNDIPAVLWLKFTLSFSLNLGEETGRS